MRIVKLVTVLSICSLFCLSLTSCNKKKKDALAPKEDPPTIVDVLIAKSESVSSTIEANGSIVANEYVELRPEVSGRIVYLNVPEGTTVNQGTIIAKINDADLQAQLNKTKVQLEIAQKTEQRLAKLVAINAVNQADYDVALNQVNSLKADMAYTQVLIEKTVLKAPFTGVVGLRQISQGAYVSPTTVIATMQQLSKLKVDFTLPEEYAAFVQKGTTVEVEVEGQKNNRCKAVVFAREPQVNLTTRNLTIRALLNGCPANPGTFTKVYVNAGKSQHGIMIPTNAIIPDDRNNQVILVKEGKAAFVNVQTGTRTANNVEITQGISEGDSVVVTGVLFAKPDAILKVRKATKR